MTTRIRTIAAAAAAILIASLFAATASYAQDGATDGAGQQTWAVQPADAAGPDGRGQLEYIVEPGDVYEDRIAVRNFGDGPLTVTLGSFDAAQTAGSEFELSDPGEVQTRVGAWFGLPEEPITVDPGSFAVVPFTFDIPADAEPGDHAGGIVAVSTVDPDRPGASVQYRVGTRVYLRVAGPVEPSLTMGGASGDYSGSLLPFAGGEIAVGTPLVNDGNVRLRPSATVTATGLFGLWSRGAVVDGLAELLPDGQLLISGVIDGVPQIGPVWVTVEVSGAESRGQDLTELLDAPERTVVVWAVPWVLLGAVILVLAAAAVPIVLGIRRRRRIG